MPTKPTNTFAARLNAARVAIYNTLAESEIQSLVSLYGYSPARVNEGKTLYDTAVSAVNAQKSAGGAQQQATQDLEKAEKAARDAYQALAKVARAVFKADKPRLAALGLKGKAPLSTAGFLAAAQALFANAAAAPNLTNYGYDVTRLNAEKAKIAAFDAANQRQEIAKGAAQQATREQALAISALDAWRAQYIKIARVALRGKPQLLEKIGIPARTSKTAPQRAAGRKRRAAKTAA